MYCATAVNVHICKKRRLWVSCWAASVMRNSCETRCTCVLSVATSAGLCADRKTRTGGLVYNHAWDAIMYMEQRTEFWRQEQPRSKVKKIDKAPVTTEKMRINNWVSREVDKIDNGNSITLHLQFNSVYFRQHCQWNTQKIHRDRQRCNKTYEKTIIIIIIFRFFY